MCICVSCGERAPGNGCFHYWILRGKMQQHVMEFAFVTRSVVILFFPGTNLVHILDGKTFPQVKGFQMVSQMKNLLFVSFSPTSLSSKLPLLLLHTLNPISFIPLVLQAALNPRPNSPFTQKPILPFRKTSPLIGFHQELLCPPR